MASARAACSAYLGRPWRQRGDHRDERRAERCRDGRRAAAARHRLGRGESIRERREREVTKRWRLHERIMARPAGGRAAPDATLERAADGRGTGAPVAAPSHPPGEDERISRRHRPAVAVRRLGSVSTPSIVQRRDRWRNASCMRASAVSISKSVRGPVTTGNAALSSRTPTTSRTRSRRPLRVTSRGRPSNQSARTRTSTGSTRIIAISQLLFGGAIASSGHRALVP